MIRFIIGLFVLSVFAGCTSTKQENVTYEEYIPSLHVAKKKTVKVEKNYSDGIIKGHITKLVYKKGLWNYEVRSNDTSNQKLSIAKFTDPKKVAKKGDLVYTIIKNGKLKELFLIEKGNYKHKKTAKKSRKVKKTKKVKKKIYKKTRKHHIIGLPTTESISLD